MNYLLDTCVLSEYTKSKPDAQVLAWMAKQSAQSLWISELTLAELRKGIVRIQPVEPIKFKRLEDWLSTVTDRFMVQTLPVDKHVWQVWADISGAAMRAGRGVPPMDALLMATGKRHDLTIVTRNTKDFSQYPKLFNPWDAAA